MSMEWLWRAVLAGMLVSTACVPLGVWLYFRRMSLLTDALSHIALPGVVGAFLVTGSLSAPALLPGAALAGVGSALTIEHLSKLRRVRPDAAIGVVFSAFFAVGVILLSAVVRDVHLDTHCLVFGDILGVDNRALTNLALASAATLGLVAYAGRRMTLATFDPHFARTAGVNVDAYRYATIVLASIASAAAFEAVGAILVVAFFVLPAAFGHQVARTSRGVHLWAMAFAWFSVVGGMALSVMANTAGSGAIVLCQASVYALTLVGRRVRASRPLETV